MRGVTGMLPSTSAYQATIPYPHKRHTEMQVFHEDVQVADISDLQFSDGSVTASLASRVTRNAQLLFSADSLPEDADSILSPYVAVIRISTGVQYPNGLSEVFPVFTGRVAEVRQEPDGTVAVRADDHAAEVVGFRFETPQSTLPGSTVLQEIRRLILQALPSATFGADDVSDLPVPELTWDEDRGRALDDLANVLGARWYALGNGSFVVRRYPYAVGTPVASLSDGPAGMIESAARTVTRDGVANSVTVVSERVDGTDPIRVTVRNLDSQSPLRFGDRFGRVSQVIPVQTPITTAAAQQLANAQLSSFTALGEQWSVRMIPDSSLEPGDTARLSYRGSQSVQVIDTMTYPLSPSSLMDLGTRSSVPDLLQLPDENGDQE